ncbi:MAG: hypothetical protein HY321_01325 [Armatimonadetes bacterium]|nr:hypothetical protein [Armatimonadota bacterium]
MKSTDPGVKTEGGVWRIANGILEIAVSPAGGLVHLRDLKSGHTFAVQPAGSPVWNAALRDTEGKTRTIAPEGPCRIAHRESGELAELTLSWAGESLGATVRVSLARNSPVSEWHITVENNTEDALWEVCFPRVGGLGKIAGDGDGDRLAVPFLWGAGIPNPVDLICQGKLKTPATDFSEYSSADSGAQARPGIAYSYPGMMTMQLLAYYHPERAGIYFGAHDPHANFKRFGAYGETGGESIDLVMLNFPEERVQGGLNYWMPYPTMVGVFAGEWWKATEIYREWAIGQEWCKKGPLRQRKDIPAWIKEVDLWYWNYTSKYWVYHSPEEIVPALKDLQKRMDTGVCIHWYEWNDWPFNQNIPESFPMTYQWKARLAKGLEELHQAGIHAIPYTNARLWDSTTEAYRTQGGPESVVLNEKGRPRPWGRPGSNSGTWLTMCPYARPYQEKIKRLMREIVEEAGMDGAYLDQITSSFTLPCFVAEHGHPRGGGNSWYSGYRQMMDGIRATLNTKHPDVIWTSEDVIECYLDLFDTNLSRHAAELNNRYGDGWLPIPMFHSVYHDYAMTYGTVQTLDQPFPDAYYFGEALVMTGGSQPMVCGYFAHHVGTDAFSDYLGYLERLVKARKRARNYLTYGRWLPPVAMEAQEVDVKWSDQARPKRTPAVLSTCWGDEAGSVGIVMVNHTGEEQKVRYSFRAADYGLPAGELVLLELAPEGEKVVAAGLSADFQREESIGPRQPRVFMVRPA